MQRRKSFYLLLFTLILTLPLVMSFSPSAKPLRGKVMKDASLSKACRTGQMPCEADTGKGYLFSFEEPYYNDMLPGGEKSLIRLMFSLTALPEGSAKLDVPGDVSALCYSEKGTLLTFKSFTGKGSIRIDQVKPDKFVSGMLEIRFSNPTVNMSNQDVHYMKREFKAVFE